MSSSNAPSRECAGNGPGGEISVSRPPRKPEMVIYICGSCRGKVNVRLYRPEKVACTNCGSRMLYKTRPASQLKEISAR